MAPRVLKALPVAAILVGASVGFPAVSSASTVTDGYNITVSPTAQNAGDPVTVTGHGQDDTPPFSSDNCDSTTITVTVTYFTLTGTQKSAQTDLGTSDGDGDVSGPVTIPSDAAPTSFNGHDADVQASCVIGSTTYLSNTVAVTVEGTVTTTTTTPASTTTSTTTTTTPSSTSTSTVPVTTTTVPAAPPAAPVSGAPELTG